VNTNEAATCSSSHLNLPMEVIEYQPITDPLPAAGTWPSLRLTAFAIPGVVPAGALLTPQLFDSLYKIHNPNGTTIGRGQAEEFTRFFRP
jgi:hypothetical protein